MAELDLLDKLAVFEIESLAALDTALDEASLQQWKTQRLGKTSYVQ